MGPEAIAIAALVVSAVGTTASIYQGNKAADESKKAQKAQNRMAQLKAAREKRSQLAQRRKAVAANEAMGVATGTAGSSSELGSIASIGAQTASNVGFINRQESLANRASKANRASATYSNRAAAFGQVANVASSLFSASSPQGLIKQPKSTNVPTGADISNAYKP